MTTLTRTLLLACAALAFGASVAYAQPHQRDQRSQGHHAQSKPHHKSHKPKHHGHKPHTKPPKHAHRHGHTDYRPDHAMRPPAYRPGPPHANRGAGPHRNWYRGSRLPQAYRTQHYVVRDWRGHHLSAPPRGHYWVQNGTDYLLIAVTTGLIAQIVLNN